MLNEETAESAYQRINDSFTVNEATFYNGSSLTPDDHGTAQVSIIAPNGDAVSVSSSINYGSVSTFINDSQEKCIFVKHYLFPVRFGSGFLSPSTGIILNDLMDDFSFPDTGNLNGLKPSRANFVKPGKRPLSSMCPTIILDENRDASMVLGAAGGMRITTAVAQVNMSYPRRRA